MGDWYRGLGFLEPFCEKQGGAGADPQAWVLSASGTTAHGLPLAAWRGRGRVGGALSSAQGLLTTWGEKAHV